MHYKYREDGNLLDDYKRFNAEQIAEVIDKVKTIEGVKWIFRQVVPFSHSHIEELKAVVGNWLSQKIKISPDELLYFNIPTKPEGYKEGSYENVVFNVGYKMKPGIEIAQSGFSAGYATITNGNSSFNLVERVLCGSYPPPPPERRIYAVKIWDIADLLYNVNDPEEVEIVKKAKQYQPKLVELLSNNMPAPVKCVPIDLLLK